MEQKNGGTIVDACGKFLLTISGILFFLGTLSTFINILLRKIFNSPWPGMEEADSVMLVLLVFLPLAYLEWKNRHLSVTILYDMLPARLQAWSRKAHQLLTLVLSVYIVTATWDVVLRNMMAGNKMAALGIPVYIPYMILLVGFGLVSLVKLVQLFMPEARGDQDAH